MRRLTIRNTDVETSALGFGCVGLTSHGSVEKAMDALGAALDSGITHFDVARLYGFGQAEGILGKFIQGKRDRVTIATKFGLNPPSIPGGGGGGGGVRKLISFARWMAQKSSIVRKLARRATASSVQRGMFDPADAARSFETSLRELNTDHVDLLLLHECELSDANREDLIALLNEEVRRGRVRAFGTATAFAKLKGDAALWPGAYRVMQFDSNTLEPNIGRLANVESRGVINFSVVKDAKALAERAKGDAARTRAAAERLGVDLTDASEIAGLMLRDALAANRAGPVLFASSNPGRIRQNVLKAAAPMTDEDRSIFGDFVRRIGATDRTTAPAAGVGP
jgi:D-threo-aldose 1-dehydrogenase